MVVSSCELYIFLRNIHYYEEGLYDIIKEIRCVVLGNIDISQESFFKNDKIKVIYYSNDINLYEQKILSLLYEDSQKEDFYVLYLHSKGVKYDGKYESSSR